MCMCVCALGHMSVVSRQLGAFLSAQNNHVQQGVGKCSLIYLTLCILTEYFYQIVGRLCC